MFFFIPDSIDKATRFFNTEEIRFLKSRVEKEVDGADDKKWRKDLFIEALKDPLVYVYMVRMHPLCSSAADWARCTV